MIDQYAMQDPTKQYDELNIPEQRQYRARAWDGRGSLPNWRLRMFLSVTGIELHNRCVTGGNHLP